MTKADKVKRVRRHIEDCSLRSKRRFRGAKSEERSFQRFTSAKNGARAKIRWSRWGPETSILLRPPPPPSYFCSRPIFRAGRTRKTPFFGLCSTETLATQTKGRLSILTPGKFNFIVKCNFFCRNGKSLSNF